MQIGVGLIGYGISGTIFHGPLVKSHDGFKMLDILSSQKSKVVNDFPEARISSTVDELLSDPAVSLIVVTSPNTFHFDHTRAALEAGKNVIVEKPFVIHSAEGEKLIELAKKKNLMLTVFQSRRWDSDFLELQKCLKEKALGDVLYFESRYDRFRPEVNSKRWREQAQEGSGVLFDLGSHLIDQTLHLFGMPENIIADVEAQRIGANADDYFHLVFKYGKMRAVLHASCVVKEPGPRFAVHGTKGSFVRWGMDPQEEALRRGQIPNKENFWGYRKFYDGVARSLRESTPPPVLAEEAVATIRIIEECLGRVPGKSGSKKLTGLVSG